MFGRTAANATLRGDGSRLSSGPAVLPRVSVIVPAYNAAKTLNETLASATAQTFTDLEVIVVDDGSSDDTYAVALATGDDRVKVVQVPNGGVSRARNHGIQAAQGELIAFLDADDVWQPEKLAKQVQAMADALDAGLCVTAALRIDENSVPIGHIPVTQAPDHCAALLLGAMTVGCVSSGLARRDVLERVGLFKPELSQCADLDLWLRMSVATRIVIVDEPLVRYRSSPMNMSSDPVLLEHDTFRALDAFFASPQAKPYAQLRRRAYSNSWMMCAGTYLHRHRGRDAVRCLIAGLRAYPPNVRRPLGLPVRTWRRLRNPRNTNNGR